MIIPETKITRSEKLLTSWIESQRFQGWDPYDALNSSLLNGLSFGLRPIGQLLVQVNKHLPINLRPIIGVPKSINPKAIGLFLSSFTRKYSLDRTPEYLKNCKFFVNWLKQNISVGYSGDCWGYDFPWPNRTFFAPRGMPTIVNTSFIGLALLDFIEMTEVDDQNPELKQVRDLAAQSARSATKFILNDLNQFRPQHGELCFSYTPMDTRYIHNANLLGAWFVARAANELGIPDVNQTVDDCLRYSIRSQRSDGSWWYGEGSLDHWIDNFHTGFVLTSLNAMLQWFPSSGIKESALRGYHYWKENFILPSGVPRYYPNRDYPIDSHCVAQSILTCLAFVDIDPEAASLANRIAEWSIANMQSADGSFHFQHQRLYKNRIPYMRWSQAWMQRALTELIYFHTNEHLD